MLMDSARFTLAEILSFIGFVQCVFILVYMTFRVRPLVSAALPFLYFLVLGFVFLMDFGREPIGDYFIYYGIVTLGLWFFSIPLSVLVIQHIARLGTVLSFRRYTILALPVIAIIIAAMIVRITNECNVLHKCSEFMNWFLLGGILSSALSLLVIWMDKEMFSDIRKQKLGQEKYWLILTIIISNIFSIFLMFSALKADIGYDDISHIRTLLGLAFVYLVTTSLFRLYPYIGNINEVKIDVGMSEGETEIAQKIQQLLTLDKIYHESGFGRADLARELNISETSVSRIIKLHFDKSLPQLLNEYRVDDAKRMLDQTEASIAVIAGEVGFNSIATFNRVFREMTGITPGEFRQSNRKDSVNIIS